MLGAGGFPQATSEFSTDERSPSLRFTIRVYSLNAGDFEASLQTMDQTALEDHLWSDGGVAKVAATLVTSMRDLLQSEPTLLAITKVLD